MKNLLIKKVLEEKTVTNTSKFSLNGLKTFCKVVGVHDGDSIKCIIPVFEDYFIFDVRLNGIDACEILSKNPILKEKAFEARKMIINILDPLNNMELHSSRKDIEHFFSTHNIIAWIECYEFDKYGRVMADIYTESEKSLSSILIEHNLAYKYQGKTKLTEDEQEELIEAKHNLKI